MATDLTRLVQSVGMKTFIEYSDLFSNETYSRTEIAHQIGLSHKFKPNSLTTKVNCGLRICREHLQKDALLLITNAKNVDSHTLNKARIILVSFE